MAAKKQGLGKGLSALLPEAVFPAEQPAEGERIQELDINMLRANPDQPRKHFDEEKLAELAESIRSHGVMQPLIVTEDMSGGWMIVAGERRYRAAELAGLEYLPCIVRKLSVAELAELSLLENIQREDLTPLEEAEAFRKLIDEHGYKQDGLANSLGKSRSAIANSLRLLALNPQERNSLLKGDITPGHARALLMLEDVELRGRLYSLILRDRMNVREAEEAAKKLLRGVQPRRKNAAQRRDAALLKDISRQISSHIGLKSTVQGSQKRGRVIIEYYNENDLSLLLDRLDISDI